MVKFNGERLTRCPRRPLLDNPAEFDLFFWLYHNYGHAMLPEGSALGDNPARLMQMIRTFDNAIIEAKAERDERERRKAARR